MTTKDRARLRFGIIAVNTLSVAFALSLSGCASPEEAQHESSSDDPVTTALASIRRHPHQALCGHGANARCFAHVRTDDAGKIDSTPAPSGYGPADLRSAYNLPSSGGSNELVAVVNAFDNPFAENDLGIYRAQYNLPPCTTANGCFTKVNQRGQPSNYPSRADATQARLGWALEMSLDLAMVSAACPGCRILLVEADSDDLRDLSASVSTAVTFGANAVSNSWGANEDQLLANISVDQLRAISDSFFNHPGVFISVSSGDSGFGVSFPASSPFVVAVGGTSLVPASTTRGWAEGVWSDELGAPGSGCSEIFPKPAWQTDSGCSNRTVADVAAVADPNTGVAVYSHYFTNGWAVLGGTSAASPFVAALFALQNASADSPEFGYANSGAFYDVVAGNNGSCSPSYLCTASAGYDGPTGVGTPNGAIIRTAPDFGLIPSSTSLTIGEAASSRNPITVTSYSGFTGAVVLSCTGLPAGVTCSFEPQSITLAAYGNSSTALVLSVGSAPPGTYTIAVTAAAGPIARSTTLNLTVSAPDFLVQANPASISINQGNSANATIRLVSLSGFDSAIALSCSGLPSGATCSFSPSSPRPPVYGAATSALTIAIDAATPLGAYAVTIAGSGGGLSRSTQIALHVTTPDFAISATADAFSIVQGQSGTDTIAVLSLNGFAAPTSLSCSGLPAGATCTFSPDTVTPPANGTGTSVLTIALAIDTPTGSTPITVSGASSTLTHSTIINLTVVVPPPDFTIEAGTPSILLGPGATGREAITVTSRFGYHLPTALSCTGLPAGATCRFVPASVMPPADGSISSIMVVTLAIATPRRTYPLTVKARHGSTIHSITVALVVPPPDFAIRTRVQSISIAKGAVGRTAIVVSSHYRFHAATSLSCAGAPIGVTCSVSPARVTPLVGSVAISTLTLRVTSTAAPGMYPITVTGQSGQIVHATTINLLVH